MAAAVRGPCSGLSVGSRNALFARKHSVAKEFEKESTRVSAAVFSARATWQLLEDRGCRRVSPRQLCLRPEVFGSKLAVQNRRLGGASREAGWATASFEQAELDLAGDAITDDYYSVLGLTPDASPEEIKKGYYACMKACHPDLSGNTPEVTAFCMFVNEVYEVLSDPDQRLAYDEIQGYTLTAINPFESSEYPRDQAFVDEFTCIGCKNCANTAEKTFEIEPDYGRARVMQQDGDTVRLIQDAIDTCPVNCIYWVTAPQLSLLEDEMRRMERVAVGIMASGQGSSGPGVFAQASRRWQKRQAKAVARARVAMAKEGRNGKNPWWQRSWDDNMGKSAWKQEAEDGSGKPSYTTARARAAAAAARRWREYSRQGFDRRKIFAISDKSILDSSIEDDATMEDKDLGSAREVEGARRR